MPPIVCDTSIPVTAILSRDVTDFARASASYIVPRVGSAGAGKLGPWPGSLLGLGLGLGVGLLGLGLVFGSGLRLKSSN